MADPNISPFIFFVVVISIVITLALHGPMLRVKCTKCEKLNLLKPLWRKKGKCKCGNDTFLYIEVIYHYVKKTGLEKAKKYKLCVKEGAIPLLKNVTPEFFLGYFDYVQAEKDINFHLKKSPTPNLVYFFPELAESIPQKIQANELYEGYLLTLKSRKFEWGINILEEIVQNFPDTVFATDAQKDLDELKTKMR